MMPTARRDAHRVKKTGQHAGFDFVLMGNRTGHWLGYVRFPEGHPFARLDAAEEIECHGGITWSERDDLDHGIWHGFDFAHSWDAPDPVLMGELNGASLRSFDYLFEGSIVRTESDALAEAQRVCEQGRAVLSPNSVAHILALAILKGDRSAILPLVDWVLEHRQEFES